jgi:hypothetical protein
VEAGFTTKSEWIVSVVSRCSEDRRPAIYIQDLPIARSADLAYFIERREEPSWRHSEDDRERDEVVPEELAGQLRTIEARRQRLALRDGRPESLTGWR